MRKMSWKAVITITVIVSLAMTGIRMLASDWQFEESDTRVTAKNTLQKKIDSVNAYTVYVGLARSGASGADACWRVWRIYTQDTVVSIQFYDGDATYHAVWDQRLTATYK